MYFAVSVVHPTSVLNLRSWPLCDTLGNTYGRTGATILASQGLSTRWAPCAETLAGEDEERVWRPWRLRRLHIAGLASRTQRNVVFYIGGGCF